ncbi:TadE/TadG family type IV pilus assembly protein [Paraurantiacibacter namhicola]|uniref:TadE-like protein n=1 Tax=Paraurantiacibacter namhicola TaxID=645517 RepID=A0A1C7D9J6_9SPHN|nr:TadE/TadG family type IV pilus assembly protein [Paraurantiacibacter namhicola]ANU08042.1 TadE-like protein [Paraurantiacibacter namhicola]
MTLRPLFPRLKRLKSDLRGATVLEFALLAPAFMGLVIGVMEVGVYMQKYNAVRNLASDAARYATVEYQKENNLAAVTLEQNIKTLGLGEPYFLDADALTISVTPVATPQVTGAKEFDLEIDYVLPNISGLAITEFTIEYGRPLFVIDNAYVAPTPTPTATASP